MQKLLIATTNQGKIKEFHELLAGLDVGLVTPRDVGLDLNVVEDGLTYDENAGKKALAYSQASGLICLADDSGLEVDALGGAPGLYSARYSTVPNDTDAGRRAFLLKNLADAPRPWKAHFHATLVIGMPNGGLFFATGDCCGEIIPDERGGNGFGYDPIFFIPGMNCSMAELSSEAKNQVSHRALAVKNALPLLHRVLKEG